MFAIIVLTQGKDLVTFNGHEEEEEEKKHLLFTVSGSS